MPTQHPQLAEILIPGPMFDPSFDVADLKSVHSDVDNTLVGDNSSALPSERFITAALHVKEAGRLTLALATARQMAKVEHILRATEAQGISVLSNGGQLFDGKTGEIIVERTIKVQSALKIARNLQGMAIQHWVQDAGVDHTWVGKVDSSGQTLGTYSREKDIWTPGADIEPVEAYVPRKPFVIIASHVDREQVDDVIAMVNDCGGDNVIAFTGHENKHPDGRTTYQVFILDERGTKRQALLQAAEIQGIEAHQMAAIGDGPNDDVLLKTAGIGVAVGNAVDKTKALASFIVPNWENDGAAVALEHFNLATSPLMLAYHNETVDNI